MPELPEISAYLTWMEGNLRGRVLEGVRLRTPSLLRSFDPPLSALAGRELLAVTRMGKRVVLALEDELYAVVHLMIAGRFRWTGAGAAIPRKIGHAAFDFPHGTLLLTEMGSAKRASLHVVRGASALAELDPGGIEPLECSAAGFAEALRTGNHTLKRALTDPRIVSGIGNAHSDEILLFAGLSPVQRTGNLSDDEMERLWRVARESLETWTARLRDELAGAFPGKITAFHPAMGAHGKFGEPCPRCGTAIQRIVYAERETNYCPRCQTGGRLLADRALSRLLREDWPRTLEEMEELKAERRRG